MELLDLTLPHPPENLALDEALLLEAEEGLQSAVLRFWMSPRPFVVVGLGAKTAQEANLQACHTRGIPVLRRCSGGGTVVQGPGCLNYSLVLPLSEHEPLQTITGSNQFIMHRHALALSMLTRQTVTVEGHTDLAIDGVKVSGNAQRRLKHHLLFHGTFLLNFDLPLIADLLPNPVLQPAYRRHRPHAEFLRNLNAPETSLKQALIETWQATGNCSRVPDQRVAGLVKERYGRPEWTFRR
jgi:lipoate-protein ligase A